MSFTKYILIIHCAISLCLFAMDSGIALAKNKNKTNTAVKIDTGYAKYTIENIQYMICLTFNAEYKNVKGYYTDYKNNKYIPTKMLALTADSLRNFRDYYNNTKFQLLGNIFFYKENTDGEMQYQEYNENGELVEDWTPLKENRNKQTNKLKDPMQAAKDYLIGTWRGTWWQGTQDYGIPDDTYRTYYFYNDNTFGGEYDSGGWPQIRKWEVESCADNIIIVHRILQVQFPATTTTMLDEELRFTKIDDNHCTIWISAPNGRGTISITLTRQ